MSLASLVRLPVRLFKHIRARLGGLRARRSPAAPAPSRSAALVRSAAATPAAAVLTTPVILAEASIGAGGTLFSSALSGPEFIRSLDRFQSELGAILEPLRARPPYVSRGRSRKWRAYMPKLARSCADTMDIARLLFRHFPFQGQDLRNLEEEVRQIGLFLVFLGGALKTVSRLYLMRKAELCERTMEVVDQVRALERMPALSKEEKALSRDAAAQIEAVVLPSRQAMRRKRRQQEALRAEGEAQVAAVEAELGAVEVERQVLRGVRLTPEVVEQAVAAVRSGPR